MALQQALDGGRAVLRVPEAHVATVARQHREEVVPLELGNAAQLLLHAVPVEVCRQAVQAAKGSEQPVSSSYVSATCQLQHKCQCPTPWPQLLHSQRQAGQGGAQGSAVGPAQASAGLP